MRKLSYSLRGRGYRNSILEILSFSISLGTEFGAVVDQGGPRLCGQEFAIDLAPATCVPPCLEIRGWSLAEYAGTYTFPEAPQP